MRFRPPASFKSGLFPLWVILVALAAGCGRKQTAVEQGERAQVLYRGLGYEVTDLDPQRATGIAEQAVAAALFEGLVREDPRDLHPVPGVADRWKISPDRLRYVFHLRPGARWSDGTPVTAQDFVGSWHRILAPSLGSGNAGLLFVLKGAEDYHRGDLHDFGQVGAHALDPQTLQVDLAHPAPYFLSLLAHMAWMPVPLRVIAAHGPITDPETRWTDPGVLVGNGPFVLATWEPDRQIVVKKSPSYWDAAHVRLNAIHFLPIDSLDTEERAFRAGQLQITDSLPPARIDAYRASHSPCLRIDPYLATYFYRINVRRPFLSNARVRRALALAVDRDTIVERILRGGQTPATAFTPPGLDGYAPDDALRTDYAAARRLLADAGYPGGQGLPTFVLTYNNSESHQAIAEAVQETWRRELGVRVELRSQENKTMLAAAEAGDYDIMRASWVADYPAPTTFLDIWRSDSGNNRTGWASPEYDALLARAASTTSVTARRTLLRQAEDLLLAAAPLIPIYHYTHVFLIQPTVHGWYPTLLDHHPYQAVWLGPDAP